MVGACEEFHNFDNTLCADLAMKLSTRSPGAAFIWGTDPGRFVVSVLSESHREGKPFFTLTQNQLADQSYVEYLRKMYGSRIYIPNR